MIDDFGSFLFGIAVAFGISTAFVIFCVMWAKKHPPVKDMSDEILAAETIVTWNGGPPVSLRGARR